jgi:hypothetical protein
MKFAYFPDYVANNGRPVLNAMLAGCRRHGIECVENSVTADTAIIWSVLWNGRMLGNQAIYEHYRNQGKNVVVVDVGALYRGDTWKVALNNINAEGYYGHQENLDLDRPRKLQISLAYNFSNNPRIIIAAQHRASLQVAKLPSVESWILDQIAATRYVTDRPIVVRPHPRCRLDMSVFPSDVKIDRPEKLENTYDSYNLNFDCYALINYNSGPGTQAAIAGTRIVVDQSSLAYPVSTAFKDLETLYNQNRDQWLIEICHTEYTTLELEKGLWIKRLNL